MILIEREEMCQGCPVQCDLESEQFRADLLYQVAKMITEQTLMGDGGESVDETLRRLAETGDISAAEAERIGVAMRTDAAGRLDKLEADLETARARREALVRTCARPLILTGSRNYQRFTVAVCSSPDAYQSGGLHTSAHVQRAFEG